MFVKKTSELTEQEKYDLCKLFSEVFEKEMSLNDFLKKFSSNAKGYSYHSLLKDDEKIIGCYSCIPFEYEYFGKKLIFGLSVDTMIHKNHRGNPYIFKKLATAIYKELVKDGLSFVFGFP
ncbi:GNAT family N-acetyltransferase, partial [Akkermansiaceae bacterium]|nr:GNAT family N-acetyltransferase [Akkermansiaceae bacterium]